MTDFFQHLAHEFELPLSNPVLVFSLVLFIILLSPLLLRRLNVPGIIGLILSGVIIGPHGLNMLEKNSAVDLFSTIGLLYIMFIAGLELDMNEFRTNRNKSLWFGFFTFIFPLSIGFPVCYYFLGYDFNASLLTACMFATHTLVAYPIVSRLGISKNQAVAVTVGGTVLADTIALILLAVILGNNKGKLDQAFFFTLLTSLTLFTAIIFLIIPRIAKWFFRKLESEKYSQYIFVLSVVFFASFLAEVAGVEPIIGAFVAGLALNKLIPASSALMNRIEFIGNSLFIPFFLISVGMLVDVSVLLDSQEALIVTAALSVVAIFGKWFAAFFTQLIFRYTGTQRRLIFGLSSARAAATLAIVLVGYDDGILDANILNGTVILILFTCIISSFATEKAARKMVIETEDNESGPKASLRPGDEHILLPIANIANIEKLLEFSIFIKNKKSPHPVSILSVVSNDEEAETNILKARKKLETFVKQASDSETRMNVMATIDHNPASGIARTSREIMANIIVLGWPRQAGLIEKLTGDKVDSIVNNTDKTIFICHIEKPLILHKRVVVVVPPLAEREYGFAEWSGKVSLLARELSIPVTVHCNQTTGKFVEKSLKPAKVQLEISTDLFDEREHFFVQGEKVREDDMLILVSARKSSVSYLSVMNHLPAKLEKYFAANNMLIIYPRQYHQHITTEHYDDFTADSLNKGIEKIQQIGKGIGNIFKKGDQE